MQQDKAEVGSFGSLLSEIGLGLDEYLKFEGPDALLNSASWKAMLDRPLPEEGVGIDQVTRELIEQVIPNGSAVTNPGFTSYITTGPTTASTLASTAASVASPQRYMGTRF